MKIFLGVVFTVAAIYGISWLITCGIIALICACFDLTFTWGVATGIWLIMGLLRTIFKNESK